MKNILMMGTFDTKGNEFAYLYEELKRRGMNVIAMNTGVMGDTKRFPIDIPATLVARQGGTPLQELRDRADRGAAMKVMCAGARAQVVKMCREGTIHGVIGMGGGGGTSIITTAMQALPVGFPKVCITTLASGNTSEYVGSRDILLFPSIVDICGINRFSRTIISRAAGAICGMAELDPLPSEGEKPIVFVSMFGSTTKCVEMCIPQLEDAGYSTLVFHATGSGGRAMEELIREGYGVAALDITTTEWADELCGGVLTAGSARLDGPGAAGIPHVIVPGCLDMVNFGSIGTVPERYGSRKLYEWNPMVTLMRTTVEENRKLGEILAQKANASPAPVAFCLPLRGVSILDDEGQPFWDPEADAALFDSIRKNARPDIEIVAVDANVNTQRFADAAVDLLKRLIAGGGK